MKKSNLAIARELRGLTQTNLATEIGVTKPQIGNWEQGLRRPSRDYVAALSKALDVDEAWIAGYPAIITVPDHQTKDVYHMPVMRTVPIDGYGALYLVWAKDACPDADLSSMSVIVGEGVTISQRGWDNPDPPETLEEIDQYGNNYGITDCGWCSPDGSPCVMIDGLPRAGWWA